MASVSTSTIQPEFILKSVREQPDQPALRPFRREDWPTPVRRRKPTDAEAWDKFESEYRPEPSNLSPLKRPIEDAKYSLDVSVFALDRFVKSIREHTDFEFDQGRLRRPRANARGEFLANPHVKLDIDMTHGRPYLGARVVIPFGN